VIHPLFGSNYDHGAHSCGGHNRSGNEHSGGDSGEGRPKSKSQQESNHAAGPGPGQGKRYGYEDGQGSQPEIFVILNAFPSCSGKEPDEKSISQGKSPQVVGDRTQKEEQGDNGKQVTKYGKKVDIEGRKIVDPYA